MGRKKYGIDVMLQEIRDSIARCNLPEEEVFEALVAESDAWKMRLEELEQEREDS